MPDADRSLGRARHHLHGRPLIAAGGALAIGLLAGLWHHQPTMAEASPDPARMIRVAVVQNQPQIDLAIHGRFKITARHAATLLRDGSRLGKTAVRANREGILVGEELLAPDGLRIEPGRDATIDVNGRRLRGTLEILKQGNDALLVINHVELEDYLRGVLSEEAPHYWPGEALRALAIAARTYAVFQRLSKDSVDYDVTNDVLAQVYGGKTAERWRTNRAVKNTRGLILVYGDRVFPTFYSSTCGGITENGSVMGPYDIPPLRGGVICRFCANSPFYRWQQRLSYGDLAWAVKRQGRGSLWPVESLEPAAYTSTGRIAQFRIRGARTLLLTGYEFRQMFGFDRIRSTLLTIVPDNNGVVLEGRGWGHGVGLCQWGVAELARQGLSAEEILNVYYPTATLVRLGDVAVRPLLMQPSKGES